MSECVQQCMGIADVLNATVNAALQGGIQTIANNNALAIKLQDNLTELNYLMYESNIILKVILGLVGYLIILLTVNLLVLVLFRRSVEEWQLQGDNNNDDEENGYGDDGGANWCYFC